jgi:transcriptional regulator with XRE-family HTH domain
MDTTPQRKIHHGQNVKRIREMRGIKQEILADGIDYSQQSISRLEAQEKIEDELLEKIAKEMDISVDVIKNFDEEKAFNIVSGIFQDEFADFKHYKCTFNPLDKMVELYERMLKEKEEEINFLKQMLKEKK